MCERSCLSHPHAMISYLKALNQLPVNPPPLPMNYWWTVDPLLRRAWLRRGPPRDSTETATPANCTSHGRANSPRNPMPNTKRVRRQAWFCARYRTPKLVRWGPQRSGWENRTWSDSVAGQGKGEEGLQYLEAGAGCLAAEGGGGICREGWALGSWRRV